MAAVQSRLEQLGYSPGQIDGIFGPQTAGAVATFQARNGLEADEVVGPITWCALLAGDAIRHDGRSERDENAARYRSVKLLPGVDLPAPLLVSMRGAERRWQIALALPGKDELRYIDTGGDGFDPAWSPRTGLLAFTSLRTGAEQGSIWILASRSGELWLASLPALNSQFPTWSPDGSALLYTAEAPGASFEESRNYRYDVGTGESTLWSDEHVGWADWSRDGRVVFTRWTGASFDIFSANADGSNAINLTNTDDVHEDVPAWSADGSAIAFVRNPKLSPDDRQIYVMRSDGAEIVQLTSLTGPNSNPIWLSATALVFSNQPSEEVRQPYLLGLNGSWQQLSANDDRIWFMSRFDFE